MKRTNRILSLLLTGAMLLGLVPAASVPVRAASSDKGQAIEVWLGGGRIGNSGKSAEDLFINFAGNTGAFTYSAWGDDHALNGNQFRMGRPSDGATFTLNIGASDLLRALSQSPTAQYKVEGKVTGTDDDFHAGTFHDDNDRARLIVRDSSGWSTQVESSKEEDAEDTVRWLNTGWRSLYNLSSITLEARNEHWCDGWDGYGGNCDGDTYVEMWLYIQDDTSPTLSSYSCTNSATVNANNGNELLVKLGTTNTPNDPEGRYYDFDLYKTGSANADAQKSREWIDLQFNFSKPVSMASPANGSLGSVLPDDFETLASHTMFTNTLGTGYLGQGVNRGLELYKAVTALKGTKGSADGGKLSKLTQADMSNYLNSISYRYYATYGDFSGNHAIENGGGIETSNAYGISLLQKIHNAGFHDAAGNPLTGVDGSKGVNIFDKNDRSGGNHGYDVIVDAVPPTYSRVGNGITPDILTQLVLNENDTVEFIVSFSEATITRRGWDNAKTYLMLNNGDKAYYRDKSADGKQWVFRYMFGGGTAEEASLLKVIALGNDALDGSLHPDAAGGGAGGKANNSNYTFDVDGRTITDYVGNMMVDRANEDSKTNQKQIESSIGWASLAVDNTAPSISFDYSVYGTGTLSRGTDMAWGQAAKVLASATDPDVPVAKYDPDYSSSNTTRPSKGIYRPDNTTGSTASAVGLIFYVWTRSVTPPNTGDNFEAIKRYSLTGEQPKSVTAASYASAWASEPYGLMMANNFSDIVPPDAAMTSDGDGAWYLHVWTADMSWDSARQLMQYEKAKEKQYKDGYDNAAYLALKQDKIDEYRKNNTSGNTTPSYDTAWNEVKMTVYTTAYTEKFIAWLDESGSDRYSDAAMVYARSKALLELADYANTDDDVWPLRDFRKADSNWTVRTARLLLDNTKPLTDAVFQKDNMTGDGTAAVELPFTVADALSGIDTEKVYYQWVLKKADGSQAPDEVQWVKAAPDSTTPKTNTLTDSLTSPTYGAANASFTAKTLGNVISDGIYILYLKYRDVAGNETVTDSGAVTVTVNTSNAIVCAFGPEAALTDWRNAVIPTVRVTGVTVGKLVYAVTDALEKPADGFVELAAEETEGKAYSYTLPALSDEAGTRADGTWYVHVLIYENAEQSVEPHYYRQAYRLDRTKPEIILNPDGFAAAQDAIDTVVRFSDELSGMSGDEKYRISDSSAELDASAEGWETVPEDGRITLRAAETGNYYLHVLASDQAGNVTVKISEAFALRGTKTPTVLPPYSCQLLTTYVAEDGKTYGVANLTLDAENKTGYRYSVTTNGKTWCNWLPYMSMIRLLLPEGYQSGDLQVKFRAPDGAVGEPQAISVRANANAIWATAEFDSVLKRKSGDANKLTLLMEQPENVTVTPEEGGAAPAENGNFTVSANGVYRFTLSRGTQTAASPLVVVVDIFDDTAPAGYISYSEVAPTNGTVVAAVAADEPIRVNKLMYRYAGDADYTETAPKAQFGFERNGTAVFTIEDEAHNETTVTATVSNIDKNAPNVKVDPNYDLYKKIGTGADLIASGATLEAKKGTEAKPGFDVENFDVVNNDRGTTMEIGQNGSYEFIVQDKVGNVTSVTHTATNIVTTLPDYTVTYHYAAKDGEGKTVAGAAVDAENPKQGEVLATVTFNALTDGRKLYGGAAKIDEYRDATVWDEATNTGKTVSRHFTNVLDMAGGHYVYTRVYSANGETALVVCDDLGNVERIPISVTGIDNTAPTLTLNKETAVISNDQTKRLSELTAGEITELFGGYTVTDNAYAAERITVTVARSDGKSKAVEERGKLNEVGKFTLVYTVTDPAGNVSYAEQTLIVIPSDGLLIEAGDKDGNSYALLSGSAANNAILPDNHVKFRIDEQRMQTMFYNNYGALDGTKKVLNRDMRYDVFYTPGLYREGQLKTIATQLTGEQLTSQDFLVTFPKPGWYTIIIRNQERTREYTTFFIASTSN